MYTVLYKLESDHCRISSTKWAPAVWPQQSSYLHWKILRQEEHADTDVRPAQQGERYTAVESGA